MSLHNLREAKPCKLLFVPAGIYLMQPAFGIDCCSFVEGVGAVPPAFLRAYTYAETNISAPDMYGNRHARASRRTKTAANAAWPFAGLLAVVSLPGHHMLPGSFLISARQA